MNPTALPSFSAPFTPNGKSGLVPRFPRDQAISAVAIHFRTDPQAIEQLLPAPLEPVPNHLGEAFFMYAEHVATPLEEPWHDWNPTRLAAVEGLFGPVCQFQGEPGVYYGYNWVDNDWDLMVLWLYGYAAKIGNFAITKMTPEHPQLHGVGAGARLHATIDRLGQRVITAKVHLQEMSSMAELPLMKFLRAYGMRHIPNMDVAANGRPLAHDLVCEDQENHVIGDIWKGTGELIFSEAENEEIHLFQPTEILGAYHIRFGYRTSGARIIHDYLAT